MSDIVPDMKVTRDVTVQLYGEPSIEQILVAIDTLRSEADKVFGPQETKESVSVIGATRDGMYGVMNNFPVLVFRVESATES